MGEKMKNRKLEHLMFFMEDIAKKDQTNYLDFVKLIHCPLPELDIDSIDTTVTFCNKNFKAPLMVTGMTGGIKEAKEINIAIARVVEQLGLGMGLGSMRPMLEDPTLKDTYDVRCYAPTCFLAGNIGGGQLTKIPLEKIHAALDSLGANALCIHLNPGQEIFQTGGDRDFRGILEAIGNAVQNLGMPVIIKEVGSGICRETAKTLRDLGVKYLDVAGAGGTSWIGVEIFRSGLIENQEAQAFWDWGIPTPVSILEVSNLGFQIIGSGGVRHGLDIAKVISLGATIAGVAATVLKSWFRNGEKGVFECLKGMIEAFRIAMLLTGSRNIFDLQRCPKVLLGPLFEWVSQRMK